MKEACQENVVCDNGGRFSGKIFFRHRCNPFGGLLGGRTILLLRGRSFRPFLLPEKKPVKNIYRFFGCLENISNAYNLQAFFIRIKNDMLFSKHEKQ